MIYQHKISIVRGYTNEITGMLTGQLVIPNDKLIDTNELLKMQSYSQKNTTQQL